MPKSSSAVWRLRRFPSIFAALAMVAVVSACDSSTGNDNDIASLSVTPPTPVLNVGYTQQLVANPTTSGGRIVDANVSWSTDAPGVATVDGNGLVTAVAGGTATISASAGGETATAVITVWHPVQTITLASAGGVTTINQESSLQLTPTFTDATGATVTGRQVFWTTSNPAAATVSTSGLVVGQSEAPLAATITATSLSGVVGTFVVTSSGAPIVDEVELSADLGIFFAVGMTDQFEAVPSAASGTELSLTGRTVVWTSSDDAVATVSNTGLVTMVAEGSADIMVSVDGVESNEITVEGYPEVEHGVEIVNPTIASGESLFYVIDVPAGSTSLVVTLGGDTNPDADPDIYLYSPTGTLIGQSFNAGSAESITRTNPAAGRYLVEVNAWDGADDSMGARLNVTITPAP